MQISVSGKQIDIGDALRSHVEEHLATSVEKYFGNAIEGNVVFSREAHLFRTDINVNAGHDIQFQGHGEADAPYAAFDLALERTAKQLRRHKRKLRDHHRADGAKDVSGVDDDADDEVED
ncbi:MAG TPA: ribosome-associated translation inhibitor RaiA [Alphaproteobacteria bacterium]|jgi:ribosomal subunit interface protein